ncbi:hypothetical protein OO007_05605 [Cocleimonas sp. KMM 6892]|uniref:hypothetical protein n=1 Tax=unclassified Cocleimonas TaxID=2639732 RepID=UPI002DB60133|nr:MULTISPECIES: hypothetical protein [unclassified Cocleimonas]MEB8431695.1 hypothetical protein [Cocleimonas sp. KMM 6892]MEC4715219.1 hypothetical protein [Cocleimonas sp. KMM 6895]MEC4743967.1 hypothetical protein [Cocleimonas sp. KMM 6896]
MKTQLSTLSILTTLLISGSAVYADTDTRQDSKTYKIATRLSDYTRPITFTPTKAIPVNGAITENIVTTTQNIFNKEALFLKKGIVKPVGEDQFSAWELVSDEGGTDHDQTAPNPLTYYAAGSASSLLTQIERSIKILGLDVEDVKIESKIFFRFDDPMTKKWSGYTDKVISNILIKSNEPPKKITALKEMALKAWAVGEGLANKTTIDAAIVINSDNWSGMTVHAGKVESPISIDNGFTLTNVTPDLTFETMDIEEDLAFGMLDMPNPMIFPEIAIAESANDAGRPYMHKIRAKSLTQNYQTWELYADDSRGYSGMDKAPTSRDYFTVGTSFCLMSQLSINKLLFQKQGVEIKNYRVEHQFNYQQDNFMTPSMTGHLDDVITRVIVTSDAAEEAVNEYAKQSLRMCFAGEGIQNETEMETNVYLNGKIVK